MWQELVGERGFPPRRGNWLETRQELASDRRRFLRSLQLDAEERDRLAAELPEGCWCFGRGGSGPRAVMLPGQDVLMVLTAYCGCALGDARRILDGDVRERGRACAQEIALSGIMAGPTSIETNPSAPPVAS